MRSDLTDITVVMDRSGSMDSCKQEAENGLNHFIEEQKKEDGDVIFSLVQFDNEYEFVHKAVPLDDVGKFSLEPRGMTALLDAVGRAINETGERLGTLDDNARPGLVIFVILTDGLENASSEFTRDQIKKMVERQQSEYAWQFTYLGANQDAFTEAGNLGITRDAVANYNTANSKKAFVAASSNVGRMRSARAGGQSVMNLYSEEERESMD